MNLRPKMTRGVPFFEEWNLFYVYSVVFSASKPIDMIYEGCGHNLYQIFHLHLGLERRLYTMSHLHKSYILHNCKLLRIWRHRYFRLLENNGVCMVYHVL